MSSDFGADRVIKKSRKPHRCDECFGVIPVGSTYTRHAGSWEGDFFSFVSCRPCEELRDRINGIDPYFYEGCFGGVGPWFDERMHHEFAKTFVVLLELERARREFERRGQP